MLILAIVLHLICTGSMLVVMERAYKVEKSKWIVFWAFLAYAMNLYWLLVHIGKALS